MNILLIEDDQKMADLSTKLILYAFGQDAIVSYAKNVAAAISKLRTLQYDAVVSDFDLGMGGGGTGVDVLKWVRANQPELAASFVFFSGTDDDEMTAHGRVIVKGGDPDEVVAQLRRHVLRGAP